MPFRLGCAIWAYKGWIGDFYPTGSPASQLLRLYGDRFSTVECNATFYSVPSPETVAKWADTVPDGFKFCPKFPRAVTHQGALLPRLADALAFLELMQGLGEHLGPLFIQLPPSYGPRSLPDLSEFLRGLPTKTVQIALEVRHPDWFVSPSHGTLTHLLKSLRVGQGLLDSRPMYETSGDPQRNSPRRKPKVPLLPQLTAPFTLVRFISHPVLAENERFMDTWIAPIRQWMDNSREVYVFMHCPVEENSPRHAKHLHTKLMQAQIPLPMLPWDTLEQQPAQLDLFSSL
ncbi:MAG: DUF72 domain-containing protein [Cyanobacteria bacterium P01_F01_bin.42]